MQITGKVERIVFEATNTSFKVASIVVDSDTYTISGSMPNLVVNGVYDFKVKETHHPKYGFQFNCISFSIADIASEIEIENFLSSGAFSGIGPATAKKIVKHFGRNTLDIIKKDVDRLSEVDGIGKKSLVKIKESIKGHIDKSDILFELSKYGFNLTQAEKIYNVYKDDAKDVISTNPYSILNEVEGIGFQKIDKIALNKGVDILDFVRIKALIYYELNMYSIYSGDTYILKNALFNLILGKYKNLESADITSFEFESLNKELNANEKIDITDTFESALIDLKVEDKIFIEPSVKNHNLDKIFVKTLYDTEVNIVEELIRINSSTFLKVDITTLKADIELSNDQELALNKAFNENIYILTGAAGSGKTTILKEMIKMVRKAGLSYKLAAPTGRAASRMTELTGEDASTIHRLLEVKFDEDTNKLYFCRSRKNPIEEDVIFIDESSMIDILLFNSLLKAVKTGAKLVLIGDPNQLPPVGAGEAFLDIINSGVFNVGKLTGIHRQGKTSYIITNAHLILDRKRLEYNAEDGDFYLFKDNNEYSTLNKIIDLVINKVPTKFGFNPLESITVLSPKKKGLLGTENLNLMLQKVLNPNFEDKYFEKFALGDKVMQIKNNYNIEWIDSETGADGEGVFNGDIGVICEVDNGEIVVDFTGKLVSYTSSNINELELAYAMTVHKSQGSEFDVVIMPSYMIGHFMESNNLIYTAVTRAKKMFVLVGNENFFERAYMTEKQSKRNTNIKECLNHLLG